MHKFKLIKWIRRLLKRSGSELLITMTIILALFLAFSIVISSSGPHDLPSAGNAFGILNTLFSGLALAALVAALFSQARELRLQRLEFHRNRLEMQRQLKELEQHRLLFLRQTEIASLSVYLDSRRESRLTFGKVHDSVKSRARVIVTNAYCSQQVDQITSGTQLSEEQDAAIRGLRNNKKFTVNPTDPGASGR